MKEALPSAALLFKIYPDDVKRCLTESIHFLLESLKLRAQPHISQATKYEEFLASQAKVLPRSFFISLLFQTLTFLTMFLTNAQAGDLMHKHAVQVVLASIELFQVSRDALQVQRECLNTTHYLCKPLLKGSFLPHV